MRRKSATDAARRNRRSTGSVSIRSKRTTDRSVSKMPTVRSSRARSLANPASRHEVVTPSGDSVASRLECAHDPRFETLPGDHETIDTLSKDDIVRDGQV